MNDKRPSIPQGLRTSWKRILAQDFCVLFFLRLAGLNLDIAYWFLTVMCETKTKKAKNTNDQNRSNKQLSTLINSRRKGKQAEKPTIGNLLLCRAKKQPSSIDSNFQIYLNCWQAFDECNLEFYYTLVSPARFWLAISTQLILACSVSLTSYLQTIDFIIHQTHYGKSDKSRAFNQFTIACELDMINVLSAADNIFIMSSSTAPWLLSPLECSPQKQNGWMFQLMFVKIFR